MINTLQVNNLLASPTWQDDLVTVDQTFEPEQEAEALRLVERAAQALKARQWEDDSIETARFAGEALVRNAFTHGPKKYQRRVQVRLALCPEFFETTVMDPGTGFNLERRLKHQGKGNPNTRARHSLLILDRSVTHLYQPGLLWDLDKDNAISVLLRCPLAASDPAVSDSAEGQTGRKDTGGTRMSLFRFQGAFEYISQQSWNKVERELATEESKIILDLSAVSYLSERAIGYLMALLRTSLCQNAAETLEAGGAEGNAQKTAPGALTPFRCHSRIATVFSHNKALDRFVRSGVTRMYPTFDDIHKAYAYLSNLEPVVEEQHRQMLESDLDFLCEDEEE